MGTPTYPVDLIAIKDSKRRLAGSIVKSWNVYYDNSPRQEEAASAEETQTDDLPVAAEQAEAANGPAEEELTEEQKALIAQANEVFARLEAEAAADEAAKQAEIEQAKAMQDQKNYNATTNSYSGTYGQGPIDDSVKDIAESILSEKTNAFEDLVESLKDQNNS